MGDSCLVSFSLQQLPKIGTARSFRWRDLAGPFLYFSFFFLLQAHGRRRGWVVVSREWSRGPILSVFFPPSSIRHLPLLFHGSVTSFADREVCPFLFGDAGWRFAFSWYLPGVAAASTSAFALPFFPTSLEKTWRGSAEVLNAIYEGGEGSGGPYALFSFSGLAMDGHLRRGRLKLPDRI